MQLEGETASGRTMRTLLFLPLLLLSTLSAFAAEARPVATILCYHEVDDAPTHATTPRKTATAGGATEQRRYTITRAQFNEQLDYLESAGYNVISLSELVGFLAGEVKELPPQAVVITVDDGWLCAYTTIQPMLAKRGLPFTLFLYPSIVGHGSHAVTWEQARALSRQKNVEIGSHTFTHSFLTRKNNPAAAAGNYEAFLKKELASSREKLSEVSGHDVRLLSYPYGDHDDEVVNATAAAGYCGAVTTARAPITTATPPLRLTRYLIHNDTTLEEFKTFLLPKS
jgi:peptidoglycan/xylan/chitin deacetylase (PgdA/CDA1 family)